MLQSGDFYPNLSAFLAAVEKHEEDNSGAFEVIQDEQESGVLVTCRCTVRGGINSCPAVVQARDNQELGIEVLIAELNHNHNDDEESVSEYDPYVIDDSTFAADSTVTDPAENPTFVRKMLARFVCVMSGVTSRSHTRLTAAPIYIRNIRHGEVPRFYHSGNLHLRRRFLEDSRGIMVCPFCPNMQTHVLGQISFHMVRVHEEKSVESGGYEFVPCYTECENVRRGQKNAHFHCICGGTFTSDRALETHRVYNCRGMRKRGRRGPRGPRKVDKPGKKIADDFVIYTGSDNEEEEGAGSPDEPETSKEDDGVVPLSKTGRPLRKAAKKFGKLMQSIKKTVKSAKHEPTLNDMDHDDDDNDDLYAEYVHGEELYEDEDAYFHSEHAARAQSPYYAPRISRARGRRRGRRRGRASIRRTFDMTNQYGPDARFPTGRILPDQITDDILKKARDWEYKPDERRQIGDPTESWVQPVQNILWSMESEYLGYTFRPDELELAINKYTEITGRRLEISEEDTHFGQDAVPTSAEEYKICWTGILIDGDNREAVLFDGIPFVVIASKTLCCIGDSTGPVDAIVGRILLKEVLKFPTYKMTESLDIVQANSLLKSALDTGSVSYERRYYVFFPKLSVGTLIGHPDNVEWKTQERPFHETLFRCGLCPVPCYCVGIKQLIAHYNSSHGAHCEIHRADFASMKDFNLWKTDIEAKDGVRFISVGGGKARFDQMETFYVCSWQFQSTSQIIDLDELGRCCAYLSCKEEANGTVVAEYCLQHVRHPTTTNDNRALASEEEMTIPATAKLLTEQDKTDVYMCGICEQTFSIPQGLNHHLKTAHKNCELCGELVEDDNQLHWHLAAYHSEHFLQVPEDELSCPMCGILVSNRKTMISHIIATHDDTIAYENRIFSSIRDFLEFKRVEFGKQIHPESQFYEYSIWRLSCRGNQADDAKAKLIGARCPAFVNFYLNKSTHAVATEYCIAHVGHDTIDPTEPENLEVDLQKKLSLIDTSPVSDEEQQMVEDARMLQGMSLDDQLEVLAERRLITQMDDLFDGFGDLEIPPPIRQTKDDPMLCGDCGQRFASAIECKRHRKMEHTSTECRYCSMTFLRYQDMLQHVKLVHPNQIKSAPFGLLCAMCGQKLDAYDDLAYHYKDYHEISDCQIEFTVFENAADFYLWKAEVEIRTQNYYVRKRRSPTETEVVMLFSCMTGLKDSKKDRERQCPAFMKACVPRSGGSVTVTYCLFHMGHDVNEVQFWGHVKKALHGFKTFKHINRLRKPKEIGPIGQNLAVGEGTDATRVFYEEEVTTTKDEMESDLDSMMRLYWETMQERLTKAGNFVLGLAENTGDHPDGVHDIEGDPSERVCHVCQVTFRDRRAMVRHLRRMHDPEFVFRKGPKSKYCRPVRCLFCNMPMAPPAMKNLIQHYVNAHQQGIQMKIRMFRNEGDFNTWREAVSGNVFRRNKWYHTLSGEKRSYWTCKFSGHLLNPPAGVQEGHCPAWIFAQGLSNSNIQVTYCLYHIGHELNADGTANDIPPRYPLGRKALEKWGPYGSKRTRIEPDFLVGPEDEAGPALLALQNTNQSEQFVDVPQAHDVDGVIVDGEVQMHQVFIEDSNEQSQSEPINDITIDGRDNAPMDEKQLQSDQPDETTLRSQINVLVRSVDGSEREVRLSLQDFPLVEKDGKKFYALDEAALIEAVGQVLSKQGLTLYEGDQLEILQ